MLLSFETTGPDCYADGTQALDGEWYALVWSADGAFDGVTLAGEAVDANDAVVAMAPLAKKGRCPYTVFQIDSQSENYHATGVYGVYLLDTRNAAKTAVAAKGANGKPTMLNGAVAAANYAAQADLGKVPTAVAASQAQWTASSVDVADYKQPKITSFKVNGAKVEIKVADMMPQVQYNVKMGPSPDKLTEYALAAPKAAVSEATFEVDAGDAKFFQVVREPLAK